jgi:glycerol-3-phosphate acyltransferase PlsY
MESLVPVLVIVGAYFFGAIPTAYWLGLLIRGIDIRKYGSGNVGISNFARHVGKKWSIAVIAFDVAVKGPLPMIIASSKVLDLGLGVAVAVGVAVILGHNWSIFIRFSGGRGMGTVLGVVGSLGFFLVWMYLLTSLTVWLSLRAITGRWDSSLSWILSAMLLPVYTLIIELPLVITGYTLVFLLMTIVKRVTSNDPSAWAQVHGFKAVGKLLAIRIMFDRDTLAKESWVERKPILPVSSRDGVSTDEL